MKNTKGKNTQESLLDYETIATSLKENTAQMVQQLLGEAVRETYNKILTEDEESEKEDDFDVEEVDDTESEVMSNAEDTDDQSEETETEVEVDDADDAEGTEVEAEVETEEETTDDTDADSDNEWAEFEDYKVSDDEYDFSQAEDEDVVKVYKLLKDDDQVFVNVDKESNKVEIKDNNTGAEYLLTLDGHGDNSLYLGYEDEDGMGDDYDNDAMNESRIFEIALNEYKSDLGYTTDYQHKDVMSTPSTSEPGKNVNDWDKGVPNGKSKPWGTRGSDAPFDDAKGKTIEEEMEEPMMGEEDEMPMEEATNVGGAVQQRSNSKSHIPSGRKPYGPKPRRHISTSEDGYEEIQQESKMVAKANKILKENKALKVALAKFRDTLQEAAVTNLNLGQIVKLISENSTTKAEKMEIIKRFGEASTVAESKKLYESISNELKGKKPMSINEEKQFTTNGSQKINETQIYKSKDLLESLDLMHRICK